jgi:endonuclease G
MRKNSFRKEAIRSLLRDKVVVDELRQVLYEQSAQESYGKFEFPEEDEMEEVLSGGLISEGAFTDFEAIVQTTGRPALLIKDNNYEQPRLQSIRERLEPHRSKILGAIPSVGRLELLNHPTYEYVGTAWMIADDVMITNRHVAIIFARQANNRFVFRANLFGDMYKAQVDFKEEYGSPETFEIEIVEVLHVEDDADFLPDMALVRVRRDDNLPAPVPLSLTDAEFEEDVVVIGYPAYDSRNDQFVMQDIFKGIYNVKRLSPGRVSGVRPDKTLLTHDCTTLGGSSGSLVLRLSTGEALGLHFSGSYVENNFAVTAGAIRKRLVAIESGTTIHVPDPGETADDLEVRRPQPTVEELQNRKGYSANFLAMEVPLPAPTEPLIPLVAAVDGSDQNVLNYIHYSVLMNAKRRMAIYTACNIDGAKSKRPRRTRDQWHADPRLGEEFQAGQELYSNNNLHRGHLVRRLDPAWGDTHEEARAALADTFFWTNCTPQHQSFNPRSWLALEDYILDNADNHDIKVTVFTGPVFKETDKTYRGFKIPEDYWKVVVFRNRQTGQLAATAYLLTQSDFMNDLEFVYGEYKTYQVPVREIERLTLLSFSDLSDRDPLDRIELLPRIPIESPADIIL